MAGSFPTLRSGNTVFYPFQDTHSFGTAVMQFLDDTEQRWRARNILRKFKLTLTDVNTYDASLVLQFFRSQFGTFDSSWSLTVGSDTYNNLSFSSDRFGMTENSKRNRVSLQFDVVQVKSAAPTIPGATTYFPQINSDGVITALPYNSALDYKNTSVTLPVGKQYNWKWRSNPLGRYVVNLPALTPAEFTVVKTFFYSTEGRKGEFTFLDPGGNLVPYSDLFSNASWTKSAITVGGNVTDPQNGNLATALQATGSNALMYCTVIPSGGASGFVLCASVWAKATVANQTLSIGFVDSGFSVIANQIWSLPQNVWTRIYCPITLATNSYIRLLIGGFGTWNTTLIDLFSAQVVPMPAAGPRLLTPGFDALRAKCRFDTDDFGVGYKDYGETGLTLPIAEYS